MRKGTKHSKRSLERMSKSHKGHSHPQTEATKRKISKARIGMRFTKEHRENIAKAGKLKHEENHNHWSGDAVGNKGVHAWVRRQKGRPNFCEICKSTTKKNYHWANIGHEYKRRLEDYVRLCVSCHKRYDLGLISL